MTKPYAIVAAASLMEPDVALVDGSSRGDGDNLLGLVISRLTALVGHDRSCKTPTKCRNRRMFSTSICASEPSVKFDRTSEASIFHREEIV